MKKAMVAKKGPAPKPTVRTGKDNSKMTKNELSQQNKNNQLRTQKKAGSYGNINAETGTNPYRKPAAKPAAASKVVRTGAPVSANEALRKKKQAEAAKKK